MLALDILTHLTLILLLGVICTLVANRFKIPNVLLLVLLGVIMGNIEYNGTKLMEFPELFLSTIAVLALVMIVFDSTSRFKLKEFDSFSWKALTLSGVFLVMCLIFMTISVKLIFAVESTYLAIIFAILMAGTDPSAVLTIFRDEKNKVASMLKIESIINTPLVVIFPFIVLEIMESDLSGKVVEAVIDNLSPFLLKFVVGIGAGVLIGVIMLKIMKTNYSENLSPLAIFITALFTYVLAEKLDGNGVLAVTTLGLLFGNAYVKNRITLQEFSSVISNMLQILVFVLVGFIIQIPLTTDFFVKSIVLFLIYLFVRYLSLEISFRKGDFNIREKIFMTINISKGIAVAVMTFAFISYPVFEGTLVLDLVLAFLLYSLLLSTISARFARSILGEKKPKKDDIKGVILPGEEPLPAEKPGDVAQKAQDELKKPSNASGTA